MVRFIEQDSKGLQHRWDSKKTTGQCQSRRSAVFISGFEQAIVRMDKTLQIET